MKFRHKITFGLLIFVVVSFGYFQEQPNYTYITKATTGVIHPVPYTNSSIVLDGVFSESA